MKRFALVLTLAMSATGHAQEFRPTPIPPANFYGGRFTVLPDGSILPTQPLVNTLQPIQQILGNLCGLGSSLGGIGGTDGRESEQQPKIGRKLGRNRAKRRGRTLKKVRP
jgi:hypothetical protein